MFAWPLAVRADTTLGIEAAVVGGTHVGSDNPTPDSGVAGGALLELRQRWKPLELHLEGIPEVGVSGSASGPFGRSAASLSLLNATALVQLDPRGRFRAGAGFQIINLSNTNGVNGDRNWSRITGFRYEAGATLPLRRRRFVDLSFAVLPNINGVLDIVQYTGVPRVPKPERGAEVDYAAAYGWRGGALTYLAGFRGLSYHTRNLDNGELVDRNVGAGLTFEVRVPVAR